MQREFEENRQKLRADYEARRHQTDMEHRLTHAHDEQQRKEDLDTRQVNSNMYYLRIYFFLITYGVSDYSRGFWD